jgi:hypothetical protein
MSRQAWFPVEIHFRLEAMLLRWLRQVQHLLL